MSWGCCNKDPGRRFSRVRHFVFGKQEWPFWLRKRSCVFRDTMKSNKGRRDPFLLLWFQRKRIATQPAWQTAMIFGKACSFFAQTVNLFQNKFKWGALFCSWTAQILVMASCSKGIRDSLATKRPLARHPLLVTWWVWMSCIVKNATFIMQNEEPCFYCCCREGPKTGWV